MNKKIFGTKLGSLLIMLVCIIVAVAFWLYVEYNEFIGDNLTSMLSNYFNL